MAGLVVDGLVEVVVVSGNGKGNGSVLWSPFREVCGGN